MDREHGGALRVVAYAALLAEFGIHETVAEAACVAAAFQAVHSEHAMAGEAQ